MHESLTNNESKQTHTLNKMGSFEADHFPQGRDDDVADNLEHSNGVKASITITMLVISKRASIALKLV